MGDWLQAGGLRSEQLRRTIREESKVYRMRAREGRYISNEMPRSTLSSADNQPTKIEETGP